MPISVQCPGCGKSLHGKDELAGKRVKCPKCGQIISIPAILSSAPEATLTIPSPLPAPAAAAPQVASKRPTTSDTPANSRIEFTGITQSVGPFEYVGWLIWVLAMSLVPIGLLLDWKPELLSKGFLLSGALAVSCIVMLGIDTHRNNLHVLRRSRLELSNIERLPPMGWIGLTALLWGIVFPIYLAKRPRLIAAARTTIDKHLYMSSEEVFSEDVKSGRAGLMARIAFILSLTSVIPLLGSHCLGLIGLVLGVIAVTGRPCRGFAIATVGLSSFFFIVYSVVYVYLETHPGSW